MEWVFDLAITGACFITLYLNRKSRPVWALTLGIACLSIGALLFFVEMSKQRRHVVERPMPTAQQARATFESSAVTTTAAMTYHRDGFSVSIPAGYRYATMSEPMLLLATPGDGASSISVMRNELDDEDPEALVKESLAQLKNGSGKYEFSELSKSANDFSTWFRTTKNGVALRGFLLFRRRDDKLWQLTLTEPANGEDATLYRLAQTWNID